MGRRGSPEHYGKRFCGADQSGALHARGIQGRLLARQPRRGQRRQLEQLPPSPPPSPKTHAASMIAAPAATHIRSRNHECSDAAPCRGRGVVWVAHKSADLPADPRGFPAPYVRRRWARCVHSGASGGGLAARHVIDVGVRCFTALIDSFSASVRVFLSPRRPRSHCRSQSPPAGRRRPVAAGRLPHNGHRSLPTAEHGRDSVGAVRS